jgi:hypothetical protein
MQQSFSPQVIPSAKRRFYVAAATLALVMSLAPALVLRSPASADPSQSDPVYTNCAKALSKKKIESACRNDQLITWARNAGYYKCDDEPPKQQAGCVVKYANKYIEAAANSKIAKANKPGTFDDALKDVLSDAVGDKYKKTPKNATSLSDEATDACQSFGNGNCKDPAFSKSDSCTNSRCDFTGNYINPAINLLTACFGIIAVISIIAAGIQYASSTGDPQKVSKAKQRITNTIIAIVCYFFLYAFLQFLIPGGIFNRS